MLHTDQDGTVTAKGGSSPIEDPEHRRLLALLGALRDVNYTFVTVTPSSHARVVARPDRQRAKTLRDVLGWSLPFSPDVMPPELLRLLDTAGAITRRDDGLLEATVRVSSVRGTLFVHSAFPTTAHDAVFLGPDSYRFADLIVRCMAGMGPHARILDYGAGAGVGGISATRHHGDAVLTLADINPRALALASANADHAGLDYRAVSATSPSDVPGEFDLIVTHPPFMIDTDRRAYRDGGNLYGAQLSLDWVLAGIDKLAPGGRLVLHTGVSIVDGRDVLLDALRARLAAVGVTYDYHELDPDIFGDELDKPPYADVERIAAVGLHLTRNGG